MLSRIRCGLALNQSPSTLFLRVRVLEKSTNAAMLCSQLNPKLTIYCCSTPPPCVPGPIRTSLPHRLCKPGPIHVLLPCKRSKCWAHPCVAAPQSLQVGGRPAALHRCPACAEGRPRPHAAVAHHTPQAAGALPACSCLLLNTSHTSACAWTWVFKTGWVRPQLARLHQSSLDFVHDVLVAALAPALVQQRPTPLSLWTASASSQRSEGTPCSLAAQVRALWHAPARGMPTHPSAPLRAPPAHAQSELYALTSPGGPHFPPPLCRRTDCAHHAACDAVSCTRVERAVRPHLPRRPTLPAAIMQAHRLHILRRT